MTFQEVSIAGYGPTEPRAMPSDDPLIYKICSAAEWQEATAVGVYRGSEVDLRDGFVHFSTAAQLGETLRRHFAGQRDLVLVAVDAGDLGARLRWEPSRGGALFPHLYGDLLVSFARRVSSIDVEDPGSLPAPEPAPASPTPKPAPASPVDDADLLTAEARAALAEARKRPLSYGVRMYACPGPARRLLVVLGEAHLKLGPAAKLGKEIVQSFELRGVETFQGRQVLAGGLLRVFIHVPRLALRALTLGLVKGSTITDAKRLPTGTTVELERTKTIPLGLHAASLYLALFFGVSAASVALGAVMRLWPKARDPLSSLTAWLDLLVLALEVHMLVLLIPAFALRRRSWSWLIHPAVGLVTTRDVLMAEGTVRMLHDHSAKAAVVVMGRAHLPGFERELVDKYGFRRVDG